MFPGWKIFRRDEGAALVELALITTFLMSTTAALVGIGVLVFDSIEVADAAHAGASYAAEYFRMNAQAFPANVAAVTTAAMPDIRSSYLAAPGVYCGCESTTATTAVKNLSCTLPVKSTTCTGGTPILFVTVTTQANIPVLFNLRRFGFPSTISLNGSATYELYP